MATPSLPAYQPYVTLRKHLLIVSVAKSVSVEKEEIDAVMNAPSLLDGSGHKGRDDKSD